MKRIAAIALSLLLAGCTVSYTPSPQGDAPKETAGTAAQRTEAVTAARFYLSLFDSGDYEQTWRLAAPALRASTNQFLWTHSMKLVRKMLGTPGERGVDGVVFTTRLEAGTPPGEYALVEFKSTSENTTTRERIVLQKERARWKIAGYFVNKNATWKSKS